MSFPVTDFDHDLNFNPQSYAQRLEWLAPYGASALFAAGGTGEFFSLEPTEFSDIIRVAVDTCKNQVCTIRALRVISVSLKSCTISERSQNGFNGGCIRWHLVVTAS